MSPGDKLNMHDMIHLFSELYMLKYVSRSVHGSVGHCTTRIQLPMGEL